jgi:hypothetical protein
MRRPDMPAGRVRQPAPDGWCRLRLHSRSCPSRLSGPLQRPLDLRGELAWCAASRSWLDTQEVETPRQGAGRGPGRFAHAAAQRVAHHGIATSLADCVCHLRKYTLCSRINRDEGGPDRATTGPQPGSLQLTEGSAGLYSSNRPGRHDNSDGETVAPLEPP